MREGSWDLEYKEYLALAEKIRYHMERYYNDDTPEITDAEYDAMMRELKAAEREHPQWVKEDSPTQIIGGSAKREAGVSVTHEVPMLSIEDVFTKEEVLSWTEQVRKLHPEAYFCVEEKIDGLSMSIRYEKGKLVRAETRGDGFIGEDVTANALVIDDVKKTLKRDDDVLELRGEVYLKHEDFLRTNEKQEAEGKQTFANPRNCAAGTLRQLDSRVVKERHLSMFVFNVQNASDKELMRSHYESMIRLAEEEGIRTAPVVRVKTDDEILKAIDDIALRRANLEYDIDGAVIKVDDIAWREDFPAGSKYSAGHIAYKYPPDEKEAVITDIELSVGMTGRINPTAVFTKVQLNGTTVSRATLHNQDFIDELDLGIGDTVVVYKSGEIIPKIRRVVHDKRPAGVFAYRIPGECPVCKGAVARRTKADDAGTGADLYCVNDLCPAKLERRIINFVSRDAYDIKGFGTEYIKALTAKGYVKDIADLFTLREKRDALIGEGLIGKEVNTDKLLDVIDAAKDNDPWRLLAGLSIPNVGKTSARTLMRHFKSVDALSDAGLDELTQVEDVGTITAKAIVEYFADPAHREVIERMKDAGVRMEAVTTAGPSTGSGTAGGGSGSAGTVAEHVEATAAGTADLTGRTYVVTGDLVHFKNRDELTDYIEARGGKVAGSVSKKTYALINNDAASNSGKNKKARELGIPVITEDEFLGEKG